LQVIGDAFEGVTAEVGDAPLRRPGGAGLSDPAEHLLEPPGGGGGKAAGLQLMEGLLLLDGQPAAIGGLEYGPPGGLGQLVLLGFGLADLVHGGGEELDHMEPVHGHLGGGKAVCDGGQEGGGHVADHLGDVSMVSPMLMEKPAEFGQALLALAGGDEDHRLLLAVQVDEHGDVIMPALAGGFVQGHRLDPAEIQPGKSLGHIVVNHPPQARVADADDAGRGQNRHLSHQGHGGLLEQQSEAAALPSPRRLDPFDTVVGAVHPGQPGGDIAMMLEEIEVAPGEFLEVVGLAQHPADRAGVLGSPVGGHLQKDLVGGLARVHPLPHQPPGRLQAKAQGQKIAGIHDDQLQLQAQMDRPIMASQLHQFHS